MPFGACVDGMTEGVTAGVSPSLASLSEGEKALSWQSPGGALTAFELGNFPLWGNFLTERRLYCVRRWLAEGKTEGLLCVRHPKLASVP